MKRSESNIDRLLKARAEIDEELRRHKASLTVLFTDIVGSTAYFDRHGDTAGLAMLQRHVELAATTITEFKGRVIKTIGDSVMAEFPQPALAVRAAVELQRRQWQFNEQQPDEERVEVRIGVHSGLGFRRDHDVYGDVVNVAARLTKRTGPAQIVLSRAVREAIAPEPDLPCTWLGKITIEGRAEKEDVFEVVWCDPAAYPELRRKATAAIARGEVVSPGLRREDLLEPEPAAGALPGAQSAEALASLPRPPGLSPRYDILGEVGRGGMGIVYKARDHETGELLALKVLKPEIAANQAVIERFKNELRLARKITHKNVCRIYEFNRTDGTAYISMEFVEGESLRAVLNRFGGLPLRKGIQIAQQICAALREAHAQGVVHRDLKPENILVDQRGNVKVMDFGVALSIQMPASLTGNIVGTPAYMAPEQAEGKSVDPRADIYALGLILFEMFTQAPAFTGDSPVVIALKQIHEPAPRPRDREPSLPPALEEAILRCLEKDPARRFQSVDELEAALRLPAASAADLFASMKTRLPGWAWAGLGAAVAVGLLSVVLIPLGWKPAAPPESQGQAPAAVDQPPSSTTQPAGGRQPPRSAPADRSPAEARPPRDASSAGAFYLQVDSFRQEEEARKLAAELEKRGFRAAVVSKQRVLWRSHQVLVGPYLTDQAALTARRQLEARGFSDVRPVALP